VNNQWHTQHSDGFMKRRDAIEIEFTGRAPSSQWFPILFSILIKSRVVAVSI